MRNSYIKPFKAERGVRVVMRPMMWLVLFDIILGMFSYGKLENIVLSELPGKRCL